MCGCFKESVIRERGKREREERENRKLTRKLKEKIGMKGCELLT